MLNQLKLAYDALQAAPGGYRETQMFCGQAFEAMPALLAGMEALRIIAAQSIGEDWTPEQAIAFAKTHAREHFRALQADGVAAPMAVPSAAEGLIGALQDIHRLLGEHPECATGNSKVHYCHHRAQGALAQYQDHHA